MYFAAPAAEYVLGGRDPGVYMSEGIQIAQRRSLVTIDRVAAAVPASTRDLFFPSYWRSELLQRALHGISSARSGRRHRDRPVSAGLSDLDCDRVRTGWRHRHAARDRVVGDSRRPGGVFRRQALDRSGSGGGGGRPAVRARHPDVVRPLSELGDRHAGADLPGACSRTRTRTKTTTDSSDPSRHRCSGLALFTRFPVVLASALPSPRRCSRTSAATARAPDFSSRWPYGSPLPACTTRLSCGRTSAGPIAYLQSLELIHLVALALAGAAACALALGDPQARVAAATRAWLPRALIAIVSSAAIYALYFREPGGRLAPHDAHAVRMFADLYFTRIALRPRRCRLCAGRRGDRSGARRR